MIDDGTLTRLALFKGLNHRALQTLSEGASLRSYAPGAVLWRAGAKPGGLFIVLDGEVRVVRSRDGRQHVIHTEGPGGTLGDVPLFHGSDYPATAIAARRTRCVAIGRQVLLSAIHHDPALAIALLERLAGRVRHLVDRLDRVAVQTVHARLATWLIDRHAPHDGSFTLGTTQSELAEELGTVREVVSRALRDMRDSGLIRSTGRGRYAVPDLEALREVASGNQTLDRSQ
jgi:CRP/FNR family transcriptional regulator